MAHIDPKISEASQEIIKNTKEMSSQMDRLGAAQTAGHALNSLFAAKLNHQQPQPVNANSDPAASVPTAGNVSGST